MALPISMLEALSEGELGLPVDCCCEIEPAPPWRELIFGLLEGMVVDGEGGRPAALLLLSPATTFRRLFSILLVLYWGLLSVNVNNA